MSRLIPSGATASRLRLVVALIAAAVTVTACSSGTGTSPAAPGSTGSAGSAPASGTRPSLTPTFCLGVVPDRARCGTVSVPLDYADPAKGTIRIRVLSVPARIPSRRIGSLLVNPGGPGASGVQFVAGAFDRLFATLNQRFDIVGFDPRGTGDSNPVKCTGTSQLDHIVALDPIIDDPLERQDLITTSQQLARACQQNSKALLPHVGTENVARDMEALRVALGDDKLNYLGFSYGSAIGTRYAVMYPTQIRAMALDGVIDPATNALDQGAQQADAFQRNYEEFLARCAALSQCPLGADPNAVITKLISDLDAHPVVMSDGRSVGRGSAIEAIADSMYDPDLWIPLYGLWARAVRGDVSGLMALVDAYTGRTSRGYDHLLEANTAINCVDQYAPADIATLDARVAQLQARDPLFAGAALYGDLPCDQWPVRGPAAAPVDVSGAPPILLVGGTNDPATPYAWAQALHGQIHGSVLLTRDGFGHTSYGHSTCIASKMNAYLLDGTVPADGTTCSS
jgi:pimeloyl-ACP methyl ester carboxylesterase